MADCDGEYPKSLEFAIERWRDFGGAITRSGERIGKPWELDEAEQIIGLCDRFHCLPKEGGVLDQDADIIRMMKIVALSRPPEEGGEFG